MHRYMTNAPTVYDYDGVVETVSWWGKDSFGNTWRCIEARDQYRFDNYQEPRYGSGFYVTITLGEFQKRVNDGLIKLSYDRS